MVRWVYKENSRGATSQAQRQSHHFTANKGPWKLIFVRNFDTKMDAFKFEKKLKSLRNKSFIRAEFSQFFLNE